jgi:hypothetical protein
VPTPLRGLDNHELQLCYRYPPRVFSVRRPPHTRFQCLGSRSASRVYYLGEKAGQRETNDLYHRLRTGDLSRRCARAAASFRISISRAWMRVDVVLVAPPRAAGSRSTRGRGSVRESYATPRPGAGGGASASSTIDPLLTALPEPRAWSRDTALECRESDTIKSVNRIADSESRSNSTHK